MPVEIEKVKFIKENYMCDACHEGELFTNGIVLCSLPPKYEYDCSNCDYKTTMSILYPRFVAIIEE